jgi:hypothetical protein
MAGDKVGGAETFFVDAIKALHETPHEQYVITRDNNPHKIAQIQRRGIPLKTASFSNLLRWPTAQTIKESIKEFQPDIIHHYMGRAGSFSQAGDHANLGWYGGYYKPSRFKHCTHHAAVTQDIVEHIIAQGVPRQNAHLLHIYAEFDQGKPIDRAQFNTPDDAPLLVSLSRLHKKKGLDVLLEALAKVPDAYLWIAGSGPIEAELKQQMVDLKLQDRVRFLGWRNDQADLLATSDICAFPSRYEPFGAVVIESWACKKPLVTARAKGPAAYVKNEENGLIVDIDDVDALARALRRVIIDKQLSDHIVENGYQAYLSTFTREVFKKNVTELYERILQAR